jgi:hypothetical protein
MKNLLRSINCIYNVRIPMRIKYLNEKKKRFNFFNNKLCLILQDNTKNYN